MKLKGDTEDEKKRIETANERFGDCCFDGSCFFIRFFRRTLVSAYAEEEYIKPVKRYYTSIQLQAGDSLWDIAEEYMDGSGYSKKEYVEVLKRMNGLSSDRIHAGQYLTVVYFAE